MFKCSKCSKVNMFPRLHRSCNGEYYEPHCPYCECNLLEYAPETVTGVQQSVSRSTTLAPNTQIKCAGKAIWCSAQDGENCTLEYGRCPGQRI